MFYGRDTILFFFDLLFKMGNITSLSRLNVCLESDAGASWQSHQGVWLVSQNKATLNTVKGMVSMLIESFFTAEYLTEWRPENENYM